MPELEARIETLPANYKVKWNIQVEYERPVYPYESQDQIGIPYNWVFSEVGASQPWKMDQEPDWQNEVNGTNGFFGGDVMLMYEIYDENGQELFFSPHFMFSIRGRNPVPATCKNYIIGQTPTAMKWFTYAIAKHESKDYGGRPYYNQFLDNGGKYSPVPGKEGIPLHSGDPGGGPGGFGLFQVTGDAVNPGTKIPRGQIWNWQENVNAAISILSVKRADTISWMQSQQIKPNGRPKGQRPQTVVDTGSNVPVPNEPRSNVTFTDSAGGHWIEDAVTIKNYNGDGGTGYYCAWGGPVEFVWKFNRTRTYDGQNYVELVCQELEP